MEGTWSETDLVMPIIGFSIKATAAYVRDWFPVETTVISGELLRMARSNRLKFYLRINGRRLDEIPEQTPTTTIDELLMNGADLTLENLAPSILASYHYYVLTRQIYNSKEYLYSRERINDLLFPLLFDDAEVESEKKIESYILRGDLHLYEGRFNDAIWNYKMAVHYDPTRSEAYTNWAIALENMNDHSGAVEKYRRAIRVDRMDPRAYTIWGDALSRAKKFDCAIENYRHARNLEPDYPEVHMSLGRMMLRMKTYDAAIDRFRKTLQIDPNFAPAYTGWGTALTLKREMNAAISKYRKAIRLKPNELGAYRGLIYVIRRSGSKVELAEREIEQIVEDYDNLVASEGGRLKGRRVVAPTYDSALFQDCSPSQILTLPSPWFP